MKSPKATIVPLMLATATPIAANFDAQTLATWVRRPSVLGA